MLKRLVWSLVLVGMLMVFVLMVTTPTPEAGGGSMWPDWLRWK